MAQAMVLAVYMPPQEPGPGMAQRSMSASSVVVDLAGGVLADGLEDADDIEIPAAQAAGQDRAAVDEDGRAVEPGRAP